MHRVLVGGIVAVCLVGMAAAGMRMRDLPGTLDGDRVNTAGKVADDQDGETAEQAEGLPEEETAAGEDSDIGLEGTADDGNDSDGSAADTSIANGSGTKAGGGDVRSEFFRSKRIRPEPGRYRCAERWRRPESDRG